MKNGFKYKLLIILLTLISLSLIASGRKIGNSSKKLNTGNEVIQIKLF